MNQPGHHQNNILVKTRPFLCYRLAQILCKILLRFQTMSSLLLFARRQIIERARIVICCSSCPRGVAPGSCTSAPRSSAPDELRHQHCAPGQPTPTLPASSSGTVLTSGQDLSYFGGHICGLHMSRAHTINPLLPPPESKHDNDLFRWGHFWLWLDWQFLYEQFDLVVIIWICVCWEAMIVRAG